MTAQIDIVNIGVVSSCYGALIVFFIWTSRTRVNHKTFDVHRENNKTDHENIRKWIEDSEKRTENNHIEVTKKLDKIEDLIRNNGQSTPRIRT